jgi:hypothetical protein
MLNNGSVLYNHEKKIYVYKDTGAPYQLGKGHHSDKAHADGPKSKKPKHDSSSKSQSNKKKEEKKKDQKDKKKDKKKEEKKKSQKVGTVIDGLKTTFVNLIQSQSSSSSAASAPAAATPASASQDAILASINKQFLDLKKSLGLHEP